MTRGNRKTRALSSPPTAGKLLYHCIQLHPFIRIAAMPDIALSAASREPNIERWLADAGFRFNPFVCLDASADPYLSAYLVEHQAFAVLWGDWPAFVFAPAGGGKTALRVQITRACWHGPDIGHPFSISYLPTIDSRGRLPTSLEDHLRSILQALAPQLLSAFLLRPHWWGKLNGRARKLIRGLLDHDLPAPLSHYLDQLATTGDLASFVTAYDPVASLLDVPAEERWRAFRDALSTTPSTDVPIDAQERLDSYMALLIGELGLSSVYLLVDGIDGFFETARAPDASAGLIAPLMAQMAIWAERRLFLKAFLPTEVASALGTNLSALRRADIRWSTPLLADVIRRRVFVATEGAFGSLDALSTPDLTDVETQLARAAAPLPREVLVLTGRLLWEHVQRSNGTDRLGLTDLDAAFAWYETQRPSAADSPFFD